MSDIETSTTPAGDAWVRRVDPRCLCPVDRPDVQVRMPHSYPSASLQTHNAGTFDEPDERLSTAGAYVNLRIGGVLIVQQLDDMRQMLAAAVEQVELVTAYAVELGFEPAEVVR